MVSCTQRRHGLSFLGIHSSIAVGFNKSLFRSRPVMLPPCSEEFNVWLWEFGGKAPPDSTLENIILDTVARGFKAWLLKMKSFVAFQICQQMVATLFWLKQWPPCETVFKPYHIKATTIDPACQMWTNQNHQTGITSICFIFHKNKKEVTKGKHQNECNFCYRITPHQKKINVCQYLIPKLQFIWVSNSKLRLLMNTLNILFTLSSTIQLELTLSFYSNLGFYMLTL